MYDDESRRSTAFRGLYSHAAHSRDHVAGLAEFRAFGVDATAILSDNLLWKLTDCGVSDDGRLYLKAVAAPSSGYELIQHLLGVIHATGAGLALAVLHHTGSGISDAWALRKGVPVSLYLTEDCQVTADDFFASMKQKLAIQWEELGRLRAGGLL